MQAVYANTDYEPAAVARDARRARRAGRGRHRLPSRPRTRSIFDTDELLTGVGKPYGVFTPYKNAWLKKLEPFYVQALPRGGATRPTLAALPAGEAGTACRRWPTSASRPTNLAALKVQRRHAPVARALLDDFSDERIDRYDQTRDFPAVKGPSYLERAPALRHGVDPRRWRGWPGTACVPPRRQPHGAPRCG